MSLTEDCLALDPQDREPAYQPLPDRNPLPVGECECGDDPRDDLCPRCEALNAWAERELGYWREQDAKRSVVG